MPRVIRSALAGVVVLVLLSPLLPGKATRSPQPPDAKADPPPDPPADKAKADEPRYELQYSFQEVRDYVPAVGDECDLGGKAKGERAIVAANYLAAGRMYKFLTAEDTDGVQAMVDKGEAVVFDGGRPVRVIKIHDYTSIDQGNVAEIRILDGAAKERTVYALTGQLKRHVAHLATPPLRFYKAEMQVRAFPNALTAKTPAGYKALASQNQTQIRNQKRRKGIVPLAEGPTYTVIRVEGEAIILNVPDKDGGFEGRVLYSSIRPNDSTIERYKAGEWPE